MRHPYFAQPTPVVLGHRGAAGHAPENTLASFELALEQGADILESDVHTTRDGVPVLIHDAEVDRTTDGRGRVEDLDLGELQRLDAGHRFGSEDDEFPFRGRGLRIPSLEEAFEAFPGARFNLELKDDVGGGVAAAVDLVRRCGREEATLLTAGDDGVMESLRRNLAVSGVRPALGASLADILDFIRSAGEGTAPTSDSMALQIPAEFGGRPLVTPPLIEHARRHEVAIHVWTINDEAEMTALLDAGVDGLVTDHPGRMRELLVRRGDRARARGA